MNVNDQECIFRRYLSSCSTDKEFADKSLTDKRMQKVIESSIARADDLHNHIDEVSLEYHSLCYTAYTSKEKIERHIKKRKAESIKSEPEISKRRRLIVDIIFFRIIIVLI